MRIFFLGLLFLLCCRPSLQQEDTRQARFLAQDDECSASKPCKLGCCSSAGHCGFGPDFCGDGCQSGCERKSDCNPGWDSKDWSDLESEHGFCGTTEEYCGDDDKVERPSCSVSDTTVNRVIGYYEAWSTSGRRCYGMLPEEIPFGYYTHINFAFATIDPGTFELIPGDDRTDDYMRRIQSLKFIQPDVKVWIAVGGWTFNDPGPTATTFSDIAASTEAQDAFISSLIRMMNTYGFDGLDLDWEYPGAEDRNGREEDFENFVSFMDRMRKKLNDKGLSKKGLSLTLPSSYWYLRHFDIKKLERSVDWFNIMSYDIHGSWDIDNDFTGPWVNSHTNLTEIQLALDLLWRNDIDPDKVVLGMSFYSRSFALADPGCSEPGCVVVSGGNAGDCSGTTGVLLHAEIQDLIKENHLSPKLYHDAAYKAVTWGDQWVSFDDLATWRLKSSVFRSQCISGIMVWAASQDDKAGTNIKALVSSVGRKVMDAPEFVEKAPQADPVLQGPAKSCTWAACGQDCPSGFKLIWRDSHREQIFGASCSVGGTSKWCCPAGQDLPTCEWRGHKNSGRCKAGCNAGEVEVGSINVGCQSGYQSACCTTTDSTKAWGNCAWTTGQCEVHEKQECPLGRPHRVAGAAWAWGNVPPCSYGMAERSYCCTEPPPGDFAKCSWITDVEDRKGKYCDACRDDQVKVAGRSTSTCFTPSEALCCDRPKLDKRDDNDEPSYDPFGSQQTKELRALIKAYTDNPTCPATILEPPIHDPFQGRSLVDEAREHDELHGRATDCYRSDWDMLQTMGTNMIVQRYSYMDNLVDIWDDELAGGLDEQYEIASLRNFFDSLRYDPRGTLDTIMYNPVDGGSQLRRARDFPTVLCGIDYAAADMASVDAELEQLTNKTATRRDILDSRNVWAFGSRTDNSPNDVPNLSTILTAILSGILSLHYARWQWYTAAGADNLNQGPFLELAYWIGPQPGVTPDNPTQYDIYRDTRTGRTGDRWVVFHLHFDPNQSFLHQFNGQIHMGANSIRVFHAHSSTRFYDPNTDWRVGWNPFNRENARDGINCSPMRRNRLWYIGHRVTIQQRDNWTTDDLNWFKLIQDWGVRLFQNGYVAERAWRLIYPYAQVQSGTDRVAPGNNRRDDARSPLLVNAGGNNGYVWYSNWRIDPATGLIYRHNGGAPP